MKNKYFKIIIDTEQYAGNFERQMFSYITGLENPREDGIGEYASKSILNLNWWKEHATEEEHPEYGPQNMNIEITPNWFNDGKGRHKKADDPNIDNFKHKFPAYLSVGIFVDEVPPQNVIEEIEKRAKDFCNFYGKIFNENNIRINQLKLTDTLTYSGIRIIEVVEEKKNKEVLVLSI